MSDLKIVPYFKTQEGWSIPDNDMCGLFNIFSEDGLINTMFPFGGITNAVDFIIWFRNGDNSMQVVIDEEGPLMLFWINKKNGKSCYFHFACLKRSWGKRTKDLFRLAASYIFGLKYKEERIFDVIIGNLDSRNKVAINFCKKIGITVLGEIPHYFRDIETGKYFPSTITYLTHEEAAQWAT